MPLDPGRIVRGILLGGFFSFPHCLSDPCQFNKSYFDAEFHSLNIPRFVSQREFAEKGYIVRPISPREICNLEFNSPPVVDRCFHLFRFRRPKMLLDCLNHFGAERFILPNHLCSIAALFEEMAENTGLTGTLFYMNELRPSISSKSHASMPGPGTSSI